MGVFFCKKSGKWGCVFVKESGKWGVCKKSEKWGCFFLKNVGVFYLLKSGKWFFFVKSDPFLNAGCISIFLFYILLIGGVRTHPTDGLRE